MKRNSIPDFLSYLRLALVGCAPVGGQAVMEGVMMRNGDIYGVAVRMANGDIYAQILPWRSFTGKSWLKAPLVRGFPILLETMVNGIYALNRSVALFEQDSNHRPLSGWHVALGVALALVIAIGLFVVAPHVLSLLMLFLGLGGDVEGLSFHLWDGFYKCAIFILYIWLISLVPDIKRVFEYHGAEHKTIHAWETGESVDTFTAGNMSRLHPRCGTTFLLFVICISIILQAVLVPPLFRLWTPQGMFAKHFFSLGIKLLLVVPISAVAYELVRLAARMPDGPVATLLRAPGLALQKLTTREPSREQLEVAVVALAEAVGPDIGWNIETCPYQRMPFDGD